MHVRVYVLLFGTFKYCIWGGDVPAEDGPVIAAAAAVLSKYAPISIEETPEPAK